LIYFDAVQEIAASEFPFVESLPKREQASVRTAVDVLNDWREAMRIHGTLIPTSMVIAVLKISKQRVHQLISDGRLVSVKFGGHHYVTELSLTEVAKHERKNGRPFKGASLVQTLRASREFFASKDSSK
jgi:hypothetical protein